MNNNILNIILKKQELFVPLVFTEKQFNVLGKYSAEAKLSNAEKKALYTSIKKKMEALESFFIEQKDNEYFINSPKEMISSRLEEAKKIIDKYSKKYNKLFISGSFLFSSEFNDIDLFIIREKGYKEQQDGNVHIIFLSEKRLANPIFQSALLISIANFMTSNRINKKKPSLSELMGLYHESVIEHMRKEKKPESVRNLIFKHALFCRNNLLNGKELKDMSENIDLDGLDRLIKELCEKLFSETYLYVEVHTYIKTLKESIKNIKPNEHLIRFRDTYEELIYGRQRSKAKAA